MLSNTTIVLRWILCSERQTLNLESLTQKPFLSWNMGPTPMIVKHTGENSHVVCSMYAGLYCKLLAHQDSFDIYFFSPHNFKCSANKRTFIFAVVYIKTPILFFYSPCIIQQNINLRKVIAPHVWYWALFNLWSIDGWNCSINVVKCRQAIEESWKFFQNRNSAVKYFHIQWGLNYKMICWGNDALS